jgi:class 3 adenylate cyclase
VHRRRLVTSVFCDLSGSTSLTEKIDPEAAYSVIRSYFDEARQAFEQHGGTIEKFIGDAVVATFGLPEERDDDAVRACRAALDIQSRMGRLNEELGHRFRAGIAVRIGVSTGDVVGGDGAPVLGEAVTFAARLERAASPGEVLISESTYARARGSVTVERLERADGLAAFLLVGAGQA